MNEDINPISIIFMLAIAIFASYLSYRSWFDIEVLRKEGIRGAEKYPSWYPLRNFALWAFEATAWVVWIRFVSTLGALAFWLVILYELFIFLFR